MIERSRATVAILLVVSMLLAGCSGTESNPEPEDIPGCMDQNAENFNSEATASDESCEYQSTEPTTEKISFPNNNVCDNTNPDHCLLPYPSGAFLVDDPSTTTGFRVHIKGAAIPDSASAPSEEFDIINARDGHSPSTQIFTTFHNLPDVSGMASQDNIAISLQADHGSVLLNMDTGQPVEHWVEVSARTQDGEETLVHLRSIKGLEHNTQYAVAFRGLLDESGNEIEPFDAFRALRDGNGTDSTQIENSRAGFETMFSALSSVGFERSSIQSAWWFHTASTESLTADIVEMRNDATVRLGEGGLGCTVNSVEENYGDDNTTFRRISGTITTPHYLHAVYPPTPMNRDSNGTPMFNFNTEVVFTLTIPQSAADSGQPVPLVVLGHGFLGDGRGMVSAFRGWANETGFASIGTDFKGWSSDGDFDAVTFGLMNVNFLQHQAERLQQSVINHLAMIKTISGVCSERPEFYYNGTNLVETSDIDYMGVSLGGIRGPSMLSLIPEIDRGVLWVAGSSFNFIAERSTQYTQFEQLFASPLAYTSTMDRSILLALMQSMWDTTEPETYLPFRDGGLNGELHPYEILYIISINDAQVTTLSADRASRTSGLSVISNSTYHPHGLEVSLAPSTGSGVVYFDGQFPAVPSGNIQGPMEYHSLAHNQVLGYEPAVDMANDFLLSGTISDTCSGECYFEGNW
ncbi:MAG: hypothetical protein MK168_00745 [Candidatus Thalassarchaeum sp.]|nr:hypothetical protein [Candidatus Thalassarchaeum sp.]